MNKLIEKYKFYIDLIKKSDNTEILSLFYNFDDEKICKTIFHCPRTTNEGSYKLTSKGHFALGKVSEMFPVKIQEKDNLVGKQLIKFDNIMKSPWIIQGRQLYFYDMEMAFTFSMVETFERFINSYNPK